MKLEGDLALRHTHYPNNPEWGTHDHQHLLDFGWYTGETVADYLAEHFEQHPPTANPAGQSANVLSNQKEVKTIETAALLINAAADIINNARTNEDYHFPRGTMATLKEALSAGEDGVARDGRRKYNDGTVVNLLRALASAVTPA